VVTLLRLVAGGILFALATWWAAAAVVAARARSRSRILRDPDYGIRLSPLTPAEYAIARELERRTQLIG
jgi:hypothetical protein